MGDDGNASIWFHFTCKHHVLPIIRTADCAFIAIALMSEYGLSAKNSKVVERTMNLYSVSVHAPFSLWAIGGSECLDNSKG